jgi:hypothetical protein
MYEEPRKGSIMKKYKPFDKPANNPFRSMKVQRPVPPYPHYTEENITKSGESAFKIDVKFYNNPYPKQPWRSFWIRGFKRAERVFEDGVRLSRRIQETLPLEEVAE